jgi:polyferredoxin
MWNEQDSSSWMLVGSSRHRIGIIGCYRSDVLFYRFCGWMTPSDSFNIAFWHYGKGRKSGVAGKVTRQYLPHFLRAKHDERQKISLRLKKLYVRYHKTLPTYIYHLISNYKHLYPIKPWHWDPGRLSFLNAVLQARQKGLLLWYESALPSLFVTVLKCGRISILIPSSYYSFVKQYIN